MTPSTAEGLRDLGLKLLCLARAEIAPSVYIEAHRKIVRRILISWMNEPELQDYVPRLLHYCLDYADFAPSLVDLTFQHMTGRCSGDEYHEQLRMEFAVLDQLNSVPWPYGIRSRCGSDTQRLAAIIQPNVPVDPGCEIWRSFRTTCENQSYARIELFAGPDTRERTEGCIPLLMRRVRLPELLSEGERVEVAIRRVGEASMRLELRIPRTNGAGPWWSLEDSAGFSDLAADVARRFREILEKEGAGNIKLLLSGCIHILNQFWHLLAEEDGNRLADWVQKTSSAIVQRNEEGLKNALLLLLGDLNAVRNESVAVVLETLLFATGAPQDVTTEFERLAILLLEPEESPDAELERAWAAVEDWYVAWHGSTRITEIEEEKQELAETLFEVLRSLRPVVVFNAGMRDESPEVLIVSIQNALAHKKYLAPGAAGILEKLYGRLISSILGSPDDFGELKELLAGAVEATGKEILRIISAPEPIENTFLVLGRLARKPEPPLEIQAIRTRMVRLVAGWYELWQQGPEHRKEGEKARQAAMLKDLLDALEVPKLRAEAVARLMEKEPFETGLLRDFAASFLTSRWTQDVHREAREMVDYHLRVIDQLRTQLQQEDLFYARTLRTVAKASGIDQLPAEALESSGIRSLMAETTHRVEETSPSVVPDSVVAETTLPPDADELLEEMPDEPERLTAEISQA